MSEIPAIPPHFEQDPETLNHHQIAQEGLAFRAQINGISPYQQLQHDVANLGGRVVSPNPDLPPRRGKLAKGITLLLQKAVRYE